MTDAIDHPHQWFGGRSYAQHGDDFAILNIFKRLGIAHPSYLDIGAHHPTELSNTALLYKRGSRGVNVEANPDLMQAFHEQRPEDKNVWAAVIDRRNATEVLQTVKLYRVSPRSGVNSTVRSTMSTHGVRDEVDVPALSIGEVMAKYGLTEWPDLLTIDAEGRDLEILESVDWAEVRRGPKVICVEAISQAGDVSIALRHLLNGAGYFVHSWCGGNMLFCRIELKEYLY